MQEEENGRSRKIYHFPLVKNSDRAAKSTDIPSQTDLSAQVNSNSSIEETSAKNNLDRSKKENFSIEKNSESDRKSQQELSKASPMSINETNQPNPSAEKDKISDREPAVNTKIYHFPKVRRDKSVPYSTTISKTEEKIQRRRLSEQKKGLLIETAVVCGIAFALIFLIPPFLTVIGQAFRINLLGRFLALSIVALGIDLIWGYTGMLSLGHGVFFALGGYALAMHLKLQIPPDASIKLPEFMSLYGVTELPWFWQPFYSFPLTLLAIVIIPSVLAAILGYLVFRNRIRGVYFSILTQASTIVFFNFFNGQQKLFNGTNGLTNFQTLLGFKVNENSNQFVFYTLTVILLAGAYALSRWLTSGRFGRLLVAIRDDEPRVRFSGYDPTGYKVLVFAISAGLAGIAGAMFTLQTGLISPKAMDIAFSIEMVIWVAVGGRATLIGAVLGAVAVNFGKSLLSEQFPEVWLFFQGALFLIVVTVLPSGVVGWFQTEGIEKMRSLFGLRKPVVSYPSLAQNPEIDREREELETGE